MKKFHIMVLEDDGIELHPNFEQIVIDIEIFTKDWDVFLLGYWLHKGLNGEK